MSALLLLVTTVTLVASGGLLAASLRIRGMTAFLLATYLIASSELIALVAALSPLQLIRRGVLAPALLLPFLAGIVVWHRAGRPPPPSLRRALGTLAEALQDPALAIFAVVVALAITYLTALAFGTPANSWDAMWYHLSRAAFWKQQHAVGYIGHANDVRLNVMPPVAEIGALYTMVVGASDRFVNTVSLGGYLVTTLAVFGIARRLGLDARAALFGALAFATLPVVVLQASGAMNDLVIASFLAACVYFLLGERRVEFGLAGLALALALGTKIYAPLALPIVALVALLAQPRSRLLALGVIGSAAVVLGSAWYGVNLAETGTLTGHFSAGGGHQLEHGGAKAVATIARLLIDFADVPGAGGWWVVAYGLAALFAGALALRERLSLRSAGVAAGVALVPFVVLGLGPLASRGYRWVFFHIGEPGLGLMDQDRGFVGASALASFYGPIGLLLLLSAAAVPVLVVRGRLPRAAIALAVAPLVFLVLVALTVGSSPFLGRYFMFALAFAAAAAAVFTRSRPFAWGVLAIAVVTVTLSLRANDEKPLSVWGKPRWWVQTRVGPGNGEGRAIRFAEQTIPRNAHIGLAIHSVDWSYPFFGPKLERTVRFVRDGGPVGSDLGWLVVAPDKRVPSGQWRTALTTDDGWRVLAKTRP